MIKIALVGKQMTAKRFVAYELFKRGFTRMRMDDDVKNYMRYVYYQKRKDYLSWERRYDIYDALYNIDPTIHIDYALMRLQRVEKDVVVEDVRYVSELETLRKEGFIIVRAVMPYKRVHPGQSLRNAKAPTVSLSEQFYNERTAAYSADYTIVIETRENARHEIDKLLDELRSDSV